MQWCIMRSILVFCLATSLAPAAAAEPNSTTNDPEFVLAQIQKRLGAISNYQCTQIATVIRYPGGGQQPVVDRIERKHLAYDSQGHGRIRETRDNLDATSTIWDGTRTIEVHERVRPNGTVIHSASLVPGRYIESSRGNRVWSYLGGSLAKTLTQALADGTEISIAPTEDGHCRLELPFGRSVSATVLDPKRGYLPIRKETIGGGRRHREDIEFEEISPGVWFPAAMQLAGQPAPKFRFTNIRINDPGFDRLLVPDLPDGSTVADEVRGLRYVVDNESGVNIARKASASLNTGAAAPRASESAYSLNANQALKRIASPFPPARSRFIVSGEANQAEMPEAVLHNMVYVFQWDDAARPKVCYTGAGFLTLSEVLRYVCGLGIAEYSGPESLLDLRLAGDWIVREDASVAERLRSLERIVQAETGTDITFKGQRIDTPVVRATGILQYHPLPGALGENDVQLFAEHSIDERGTCTGHGSGALAQLFRHITNRTGRRFIDETLSSDMNVSWSDYDSSRLASHAGFRQGYRYDLAQLLEHVAQQTGLTFTMERRKIDEWLLHERPLEFGS